MTEQLNWTIKTFQNLDNNELYEILRLRSEVFVVEQHCIYQDLDGKDIDCLHVMGRMETSPLLVAYTRIVPPGISYGEPSIGRVLTASAFRQHGFGAALMSKSIQVVTERYPRRAIRISAQTYLRKFYSSLGFRAVSEPYDEDGIEHVEMLRLATGSDEDPKREV